MDENTHQYMSFSFLRGAWRMLGGTIIGITLCGSNRLWAKEFRKLSKKVISIVDIFAWLCRFFSFARSMDGIWTSKCPEQCRIVYTSDNSLVWFSYYSTINIFLLLYRWSQPWAGKETLVLMKTCRRKFVYLLQYEWINHWVYMPDGCGYLIHDTCMDVVLCRVPTLLWRRKTKLFVLFQSICMASGKFMLSTIRSFRTFRDFCRHIFANLP